jgi:hypothetical protein
MTSACGSGTGLAPEGLTSGESAGAGAGIGEAAGIRVPPFSIFGFGVLVLDSGSEISDFESQI